MKRFPFFFVVACFGGVVISLAQSNSGAVWSNVPDSTPYVITKKDGNSRVWERTEYEQSSSGQMIPKKHSYIELATGLNHKAANDQWVESKEEIEIQPDGTAAATRGQHQVYFPSDIYSGQIELVTPDGRHLRSQPAALSYDDGTNMVLIAVLTNSVGQLINSNQVLFPKAFSGIDADLLYTYTKAGFEQDIVMHTQPSAPGDFNLNPNDTRLQVITEFFDPPQPNLTVSKLSKQAGMVLDDNTVEFGTMRMVPGKAFVIGKSSPSVQVAKSWTSSGGRQFLVEEIPVAAMATELENLPLPITQNASHASRGISKTFALPPSHLVKKNNTSSIMLAKSDFNQKPGVVMDYVTVISGQTNFTFQGDTTYYVSGNLYLYGTNIFEGGTVIKYASGGNLITAGSLLCKTGPYRPACFTSMNDNTIGETIGGSSGTPSTSTTTSSYLNITSDGIGKLKYLRFAYGYFGVSADNEQIWHSQFVRCNTAVSVSHNVSLYNVLFAQCSSALDLINTGTIIGENLTVDCSLDGGTSSILCLTNCIFAGSGVNGTIYANGCVSPYNLYIAGINPVSGPYFQTFGGGSYYLTNNSPLHNAGATNIDLSLLADLATKTTYPPVVYSNVTLSGAMTFSPQAQRDGSGIPDLGYHYDPVDYFFGGVHATTNLTFTAGAVMGWFELPGSGGPGYGISLPNYVSATFNGTVTSPCVEARYDTVQEGGNGNWKDKGWLGGIIGAGSSSSAAAASLVNAKFTHFALLNNSPNDVRDYYAALVFQPTDCEFWSGGYGGYVITVYATNCLFDRAYIAQDSGEIGNAMSLVNCTFHGGAIYMNNTTALPIYVLNCALDGTYVSCTSYGANASYATYDYNAYTNASNPFPIGGAHNVPLTGSFNWQAGWLGNYYLPINSPLINRGSTTADQVGLYHFTTQVDQTIEGSSQVDIGYHYVGMDCSGIDTVWVEDAPPAGASLTTDGGDSWTWVSSNPAPFSALLAHQSNIGSGEHQHYFTGATSTLTINTGDTMIAYIYLDPTNQPTEVMLQWYDSTGNWEHRAYWGADNSWYGTDGTVSRHYMGALPPVGQWVRLQVPASAVGLEGLTLTGMAFTLWDGKATWDYAGKSGGTVCYDTNGDGIPDYLEDINGNGLVDSGEIGWNIAGDLGLQVIISQPRNGTTIP